MAIFLNWRNLTKGSKERFITSLFSSLSARWYPRNAINPSGSVELDTYNFFDIYSEEFYLANQEIEQTFQDLSLQGVRTSTIANRNSSKLYDNFGYPLNSAKLSSQYHDEYELLKALQAYRQELRFLNKSYLGAASVYGLNNLGYAFTGMSPLIKNSSEEYDGWVLTTYTGSVDEAGEDFIVLDQEIPLVGNLIYTDGSIFAKGDEYAYSYSKLGHNTVLHSKKSYNSDLNLLFYTNETGSAFKSLVEENTKKLVRADIKPIIKYSNKFVFYRPYGNIDEELLDPVLALSDQGYLYNTQRIFPTGSIVDTDVLELPADYLEYNWFYDWMINTRNYGDYDVEIRSYPTSSIPDSVPYNLFSPEFPEVLTTPTVSGLSSRPAQAHWMFQSTSSIHDISGQGFNLSLHPLFHPSFTTINARDERRYCFKGQDTYVYQIYKAGFSFKQPFSCEMWINGIDSTTKTSKPNSFMYIGLSDGTVDNYHLIKIDTATNRLALLTGYEGDTAEASVDISNLFTEEGSRFHYLGITYVPAPVVYAPGSAVFGEAIFGTSTFGSVEPSSSVTSKILFYLDGQLISEQDVVLTLPTDNDFSTPTPPIVSIATQDGGFAFDEVLMSNTFLDEVHMSENYEKSRPRIYRQGIPSGSIDKYHQARFKFYAYDENEVEFHQFSIKGDKSPIYKHKGRKWASIFTHPIFKM